MECVRSGDLGMYCRTGIGRGRNLGRNDCDCGHAVYVIPCFSMASSRSPLPILRSWQDKNKWWAHENDRQERKTCHNEYGLRQKDQKKKLISPTQKVAKSTADEDISRQVAVFARTIDFLVLRQIRQHGRDSGESRPC